MLSVKNKFPIHSILGLLFQSKACEDFVFSPTVLFVALTLIQTSLSSKPKIAGEPLMRTDHLIKNEQVITPRSLPFLLFNKSQISLH